MASASLAVVALAWACARSLGRDQVFVALAIGLNPLVLVHVVGGAHNDALTVALWMGALTALLVGGRSGWPGSRGCIRRCQGLGRAACSPSSCWDRDGAGRCLTGALLAAVGIFVVSLAVFGLDAFDALGLIGSNQERTSRWSIPQRTADGIALITGGSASDIVHFTRAAVRRRLPRGAGAAPRRAYREGSRSHWWVEERDGPRSPS